jgi:hypothetical protein
MIERELFSYVNLEARVRGDHPLRGIRAIVNEALAALARSGTIRRSRKTATGCSMATNGSLHAPFGSG